MTQPGSRDPQAMAEITASIRRIVNEQNQRLAASPLVRVEGDVLVLTPEMRLDAAPHRQDQPVQDLSPEVDEIHAASAPATTLEAEIDPGAPESEIGSLSLDEAAIVDISRAVMMDELRNCGEARDLLRRVVREEIAAALTRRG